MTLEETLASLLDAKITPIRLQLEKVNAELAALRQTLPPQLLTIPEAAERLGLSATTVRRHIRTGALASRRIGRSLRVELAGPAKEEITMAAHRLDRS